MQPDREGGLWISAPDFRFSATPAKQEEGKPQTDPDGPRREEQDGHSRDGVITHTRPPRLYL